MSEERDEFCDQCAIVMSLHPWPDEDEPGCNIAQQKVDLMDQFFSIFEAAP